MNHEHHLNRKKFLTSGLAISAGIAGLGLLPNIAVANRMPYDERNNVIGPRNGFSTQIGTLLSMMTWMRAAVERSTRDLTMAQLDYLHDDQSNTIGAMLLHLAATERFYQLHTFDNKKWGDWPSTDKEQFEVAMSLGDAARKQIKGNSVDFYITALNEVRNRTIEEFKKRDDAWLMTVDEDWSWGPTNNYCKWFHVCEHESNHNGQIKWIRSRLQDDK